MEGERKKAEDEAPLQEGFDFKKEALLFASSLKKGWQYVEAYFRGQAMSLTARTEKEASEAELQKAKMQVEATDEAERRRIELNKR
ncbi:uncharacterized protein LOC110039483 [Phalaenopsis equestris]|uniref:uncharacterized protein LOC110039483 n=1 Tax=Phalaenopsis equestris TaxID=78828 RepID=UPI0009E4B746|nr:uncharacterized protein LOC110039483 [Phalaenopsis equestris]